MACWRRHEAVLPVALAALAPSAVEILNGANPLQAALDIRFAIADPGRRQSAQREERAVDVIHTPAPVPASVFFLDANQVLHALLNGRDANGCIRTRRALPARAR